MMIGEKVRISLLSFWLGIMAFFSFVVAPSAFAVLPEKHLAGNIVNRVLGITEICGMAIGVILLLVLLLSRVRQTRRYYFEMTTIALMTISMAVSHFAISRWMHDLRLRGGDKFYLLPVDDPIRVSFDQLHQASVWLMGFAMLAALFLIIRHIRHSGGFNQ